MQTLGWREGRDYVVEHAPSEGRAERFPAIAADLVQRRVDAIVTAGTPPSLAARDATRATPVPVVFFFVGDPVGSGLVASLARPGGNLTGLGGLGTGAACQAARAAQGSRAGGASRGHLPQPRVSTLHASYRREIEPAAARLGLELVRVDLRTEQDVERGVRDRGALQGRGAAHPRPAVRVPSGRADREAGAEAAPAGHLADPGDGARGGPHGLRFTPRRRRRPCSLLPRSHPQGHAAAGVAGGAAVALLSGRQPGDGARSRHRPAPGESWPGPTRSWADRTVLLRVPISGSRGRRGPARPAAPSGRARRRS